MLEENALCILPSERSLPGNHFIKNRAIRVDIDAVIYAISARLRWSQVERRADVRSNLSDVLLIAPQFCDTDVHQTYMSRRADPDIAGFDVKSNESLSMSELYRAAYRQENR